MNAGLLPWLSLKRACTGKNPFTWVKVEGGKVFELPHDCKWPRWLQVAVSVALLIPATLLYYAARWIGGFYTQKTLIGPKKYRLIMHYLSTESAYYASLAVRTNLDKINLFDPSSLGSFHRFPSELLVYLLSFAIGDDVNQRAGLSRVCKAFYRATNSLYVWESLHTALFLKEITPDLAKPPLGEMESLCKQVIQLTTLCNSTSYKEAHQKMAQMIGSEHIYKKLPFVKLLGFKKSLSEAQKSEVEDRSSAIRAADFLIWKIPHSHPIGRFYAEGGYPGIFLRCECKPFDPYSIFWLVGFPIRNKKNSLEWAFNAVIIGDRARWENSLTLHSEEAFKKLIDHKWVKVEDLFTERFPAMEIRLFQPAEDL